jgi:DNA-binding NtrC family response regulator
MSPKINATPEPEMQLNGVPATLEEVERLHIMATLRYTEGNKLRAAEILGIGRYSLYRKAERLGIDLDAWHLK